MFAHLRQRRPVDALRAKHVDVVEVGELFGRERFGRTKRHVAGIVDRTSSRPFSSMILAMTASTD